MVIRRMLSRSFISVMTAVMLTALVAVPVLASPATAVRTLPASVESGGEFDVTIQTEDCGAFGQVEETLPGGFTYLSCLPEDIGVEVVEDKVKFTFLGSESFTYRVEAPAVTATTSYAFQGIVRDEDGDSYPMDDGEIEVTAVPPVVTAGDASDITTDSVMLSGVLESLSNSSSIDVSFEWGTTMDYGRETAAQEMTAAGSFSFSLADLLPQTTYHFRAKAAGNSTGYSGDKTFTTLSPCFIATAAYGTPTAEEIDILREFRDDVLLPSRTGAAFVAFYYSVSPPVADFISRHEILRAVVREGFVAPIAAAVRSSRSLWSS
ncbi:MAG: hypothetical protein J7K94_05515 [Dehalococcoidia bacterium]|nr:hypothetical protein [Dehalococcoidia bacterium]